MSRQLKITTLLLVIFLTALVTVIGCKSNSKTADSEDTSQAQGEAIQQTTCPVMAGNPIDKNVFVEYQGKKVYFCCPDCKAAFQKNPEKYLDKLPQFKEQAESMTKQTEQTMKKASDEMKKAADNMPDMQ